MSRFSQKRRRNTLQKLWPSISVIILLIHSPANAQNPSPSEFFKEGRFEEAKLLFLKQNSALGDYNAALCAMKLKQDVEAESLYQSALAKDGTLWQAKWNLVLLKKAQMKQEDAYKLAEEGNETYLQDFRWLVFLIQADETKKNFPKAIEHLKSLRERKNSTEYDLKIARLLIESNAKAEAKEWLSQIHYENSSRVVIASRMLRDLGEQTLAEQLLRNHLDLETKEGDVIISRQLAHFLTEDGRFVEGIVVLEKKSRIKGNADLSFQLANLYRLSGNHIKAQEKYQEIETEFPKMKGSRINSALLYMERESYEKAEKELIPLVQENDAEALYLLGTLYIAKMNKVIEGQELLTRFIQLRPNDPRAAQLKAQKMNPNNLNRPK